MLARPSYFNTLLRLSRAQMTTISAVTHLAASVLSTLTTSFSTSRFLQAWLFILLTQFTTHFFGEVYDVSSDELNKHGTPITGGSKVLPQKLVTPTHALRVGCFTLLLSLLTLWLIVPKEGFVMGAVISFLAYSYSAPPLLLNHRAFGELDASIITSYLVPYFSAVCQKAIPAEWPWYNSQLDFLIFPPLFVKFSLFLALNIADRRPDWAGNKTTLAVILGDRRTSRLHLLCMVLAYSSAVAITHMRGWGKDDLGMLCFILPSAPLGFWISAELLKCHYRIDRVLPACLLHSTLVVWGVLLRCVWTYVWTRGVWNVESAFVAFFGWITIRGFMKGRRGLKKPQDADEKEDIEQGLIDMQTTGENSRGVAKSSDTGNLQPDVHGDAVMASSAADLRHGASAARCDVAIVGAGVGGLVAAAALRQMGLSVIVMERRGSRKEAETGADLALWPGAIAIMKSLGVPAAFFEDECFPLHKVHMCNMDFELLGEGEGAQVLKTIDMKSVTQETGEDFVLVGRQRLLDCLREVVGEGDVLYAARVEDIVESEDVEKVTLGVRVGEEMKYVTARIAIGADGARSVMRKHVSPDAGGSDAVRFCGEVCYRGVLGLSQMEDSTRVERLFPDKPEDKTMRINYGAGLRSSFGYMSGDGKMAYWWVKEICDSMPPHTGKLEMCTWPEPLKTLHDVTPEDAFYMHAIEDSATLRKWSSNRVVLLGDAAHVVTPNMGQGACLAAEDAFVLATELVKFWKWADGHTEAFYTYEQCRKPYAEGVAGEARKQLFLGQLTSRPAVMIREFLLRVVPMGVLVKTLKRNCFDVDEYVQRFREAREM